MIPTSTITTNIITPATPSSKDRCFLTCLACASLVSSSSVICSFNLLNSACWEFTASIGLDCYVYTVDNICLDVDLADSGISYSSASITLVDTFFLVASYFCSSGLLKTSSIFSAGFFCSTLSHGVSIWPRDRSGYKSLADSTASITTWCVLVIESDYGPIMPEAFLWFSCKLMLRSDMISDFILIEFAASLIS